MPGPDRRAGMSHMIEAVEVPRWAPALFVSDAVLPTPQGDTFRHRAPARFTAPRIMASPAQPLMVTGHSFTVVAEQGGLVPGSTYLFGDYRWDTLLDPVQRVIPVPDRMAVIAGNWAWTNHYHWLFQCLAPILLARPLGLDDDFVAITPVLDAVRRESLALCGIGADRIVELGQGDATMPRRGVHSNLTTGDFAFVPHPALVKALADMAGDAPRSPFAGRRVYIARTDSANRAMTNEAELIAALSGTGFAIVLASRLTLLEQIALFRDAAMIVAAHGAGLTNIVFAAPGNGPAIVELHQENYLHQAFLKICQVKRLRYASVLNPVVDRRDGPHSSTWRADIPLVLRAVAEV